MTVKPSTRFGVVGLLIDPRKDNGFVSPLVAEIAPDWVVAPNLPFTATELQRTLQTVLSSSPLPELLPDFFAFRVTDRLGQKTYGSSMTVSALLALMDAVTKCRHPLLGTAVAIVESSERDFLRPVEHIALKMRAFEREVGNGTLLVRAKHCPEAEAFDHLFQTVWAVESWTELSQKLEEQGLLAGFHDRSPLDRHKFRVAIERLSVLCAKHSRYREALELAERLAAHPIDADVTAADSQEVRQWKVDLYRHMGRNREARQHARAEIIRLRKAGVLSSYDQQARATVVFAASQYDLHCFEDICRVLTPWCVRLTRHPMIVAPLTRVMVYNTLARAQVVIGSTGWESHYRRSLDILSEADPFDRARTYNYLLHGLLRENRLDEAEQIVTSLQLLPAMSPFSQWMLGFGRAELARRRTRMWSDSDLDALSQSDGVAGHALGFYLQATARQPGRSLIDATQRFRQARELFLRDVTRDDENNLLCFLAECMNLSLAAWSDDLSFWKESIAALHAYVRRQTVGGFAAYYHSILPKTDSSPTTAAVETLLCRVPYL